MADIEHLIASDCLAQGHQTFKSQVFSRAGFFGVN